MAAARPLPATSRSQRSASAARARSPRRSRAADHNASRKRIRRRARLFAASSIALVGGSFLVVGAGQALVAAHQVALDEAQRSLSAAVARDENLQFSVSKLESPARIVEIAEGRYGMVVPKSVLYLAPVNPGLTVIAAARRSSR
jgi:cell division protein FtsB